MSRQQDSVIDDDDDCCPLCVEEFDLGDKNFRPCPCGYQICQFCFNSLRKTYESSNCPNCRRPYDDKTIEYKVPTAEEQRQDLLNKTKRAQAAKRKDVEKREVETSSRRNLAGVRVKQQNLVYIIGLVPTIKDEHALLQTLRGPDYFGQYGEVDKIVVSKAKPGAPNQGVGVYVTYARKEDAALCIQTIDGTQNGDRTLRAQFGTTKYCSAFLRGEICTNKNCSFLHETGEDGQNSSMQGEPHAPRPNKQLSLSGMGLPPRPLSTTQSVSSQPMARQGSKDSDSRKGSTDGSALPVSASWANAIPIPAKVRRPSQSTSHATPSPQLTHAGLSASHKSEKSKEISSAAVSSRTAEPEVARRATPKESPHPDLRSKPIDSRQALFDSLLKRVSSTQFHFLFNDSSLSEDERAAVERIPCMIDPFGGAKRRIMHEKEMDEDAKLESEAKLKLEAQATSAAEEALEEENMMAGSLALGGEPEDNPRGISARGAIGQPTQTTPAFLNEHFGNLSLNPRNSTPQQRQQAGLGPSAGPQAPGLQPPTQNTAFELSNFDRSNPQYSQAQYDQISNHQRHGSRYFNSESKGSNASRFQGQQQPFYSGGVQGPPPGLNSSGTPPVSGGGMFAHGQNFTNPGFGASKDTSTDVHARGRSGTSGGPDVSKRGGVEHLADPSIVQARIHQGGNNGQGLFGGQQVDETNFPPLPGKPPGVSPGLHSRVASFQSRPGSSGRSTPKVPPGFEGSHAHPPQQTIQNPPGTAAPMKSAVITAPVLPAVPTVSRSASLRQDDGPKQELTKAEKGKAPEISLGSPKPRQPRLLPKEQTKEVIATSEQETKPDTKLKDIALIKPPIAKAKEAKEAKVQKPMKIEIPAGIAAAAAQAVASTGSGSSANLSSTDKPATPITREATIVATPPVMSPRPATPATAASEASRASMPRPRTLRVTTSASSKPVEAAPQSATTERSVAASLPYHSLRTASRQASISMPKPPFDSASQSRPSTPAMSDRLMSEGVSRASSPPPSIVGSAPERTKTKNQLKKERKEKAKTSGQKIVEPAQQSAAPSETATPPTAEEVGPIVARQKKQKKKSDGKSVVDELPTRPAPISSIVKEESSPKDSEPSKPSTPIETLKDYEDDTHYDSSSHPTTTTTNPYTLHSLYSSLSEIGDDAWTSADLQDLLNAHVSPMPKILSSLISSGDLARDHPWFNPPPFTSAAYKLPNDGRKGQDYLDAHGYTSTSAFGYVYLPVKERKALERGSAVGVNPVMGGDGVGGGGKGSAGGSGKGLGVGEELLKRCLITPNGVVYRHLSAAEGEKVLELEERRDFYIEEFGEDVGGMQGLERALEEDDHINLVGGMEELGRYGERHGVVWVGGKEGMGSEVEKGLFLNEDGEEVDMDGDGLSDVDDEDGDETDDLGIDLDDGLQQGPEAWDAGTSRMAQAHGRVVQTTRVQQGQNVNLRALDVDTLQKRVLEKQKELEVARKEMDKMEKMMNKKHKEFHKWREGMLRA